MQITEKSADGLARTYSVTVTQAALAERLDAKLREIAPQMNIKGFRKGKVPVAHVKRMYGQSVMGDLLNEIVQEGVNRAVSDNNVRPASQPEVKSVENVPAIIDGKADLAFDVDVDILPDFTPVDVRTLKLTRPVAEASDEDIATALSEIARQSQSFEAKKGKAKDGDAVVCDFVGKIDGEAFAGGAATDATVVLGSGSYIPGFEEQLTGATAGEERVLNVTFPEAYGVKELAGKAATFDVTVKEVRAPVDTAVDDELAKKVGLSDLEALRTAVKGNIERELSGLSRQRAKRSLLDALDSSHSFDLPRRMVDAEFASIWAQVEQDRTAGNADPEDAGKSDEDLRAEYRTIAERRVRLGLVLAEIGRASGVEVKDEEVGRALQAEAMRFPGQEQQVYDFFRKNPQMVAQLRAPIYEEKVVDFVLDMAEVTNVTVTRAELEAEDGEAPAAAPAETAKPKKAPAKKKAAEAPADAEGGEDPAAEAPKKAPARKKKTDA